MRLFAISAFSLGLVTATAAGLDPRVPNLFEGAVMTNESVAFMGTDDAAPLLYAADEILSVWSSDLKTEYEQGVDWTFDPTTRRITPTANTRMVWCPESDYYPATGTYACNLPGKNYVFFSEGAVMHQRQVWVTYRHSDAWTGPAPRDDSAAFAPLLDELFDSCRGTILMYGDSITTGANSSKCVGQEPKIESWPVQVYQAITNLTGNARLKYVNTAVGGKTSTWGVENVKERVTAYDPKLVLVAFGMNDGDATANYTNRIAKIVRAIREDCPAAAVVLVSPMIPNPEANGFDAKGVLFPEYERGLAALVNAFRADGMARIGLANVTTMHGAVLARKRFRDMTGNNINHCNDFSARIYRDTILAALGVSFGAAPEIPHFRHSTAWFDGGIAEGWPTAATTAGGSWRNAAAGDFTDGRVKLTNAVDGLSFAAVRRQPEGGQSAVVTTQARFVAYTQTPPVPADAATGIVAVYEGFATNYFVLAKGAAGGKVWRRVQGAQASTDEDVEVTMTFGRDAEGRVFAEYKIGDFVTTPVELAATDIGEVAFRGTGEVSALSGHTEFCPGVIVIFR